MPKRKLLVVEDDAGLQRQLRWSLDEYDVVAAGDRESALALLRRHQPPVVTMDLGLPPDADGATEGLALLQQIIASAPDTKVVVLSGNRDRTNVLKAISMGAYDFHQKPLDADLLRLVIERAFFLHAVQQDHRRMLQIESDSPLAGIISRDPGMLKVCRSVEKVAPSSATVLLLGASGSGKELIARGLHRTSGRNDKRFVAINCAAIPEHLLESELFGYEKGAFTGAVRQTPGKIELAQGGTFFLDEIGDMAMALQAKLLRFLQERVIERVGGRNEIPVDVRIVCATHRNLKALVNEGSFREDLFYRLSEIVLVIPSLRDRVGDTVLLAQHFKNRFCATEGRATMHFSPDALIAIEAYSWPGNVREMENCIRRAVIMAEGSQLTTADLGLPEAPITDENIDLRTARDAAEYRVMVKALARSGGNIAKAAEMLGISRPTLYDLLAHHGIK
ncbi:PEP-CTERM-box response regulator transcription factor [Pseudoduganella albidiflava]|uniref:PEP-CTERM-box response regulator transcription factor n=1 Tax=Pseudoduganella albidiflava TaxID=321983 RepID=A0A411X841_9BURK|nr:PEP-CTERM-box response regulator transcription factor [Pseudoduganella albidiflava]QBI05013.1 PEP-CTERM-box response regulator transcription factor [Pseudoduganella albidiflava]GGY34195.1 PEP-CTERM-box response regulator transcription factor [Pseudoduganella albidiflava]